MIFDIFSEMLKLHSIFSQNKYIPITQKYYQSLKIKVFIHEF